MPSESGFPTLTSGAFQNQKFNKQTSHEWQKTLDSSCISFCTSSGKRQLKESQVDTKLCQLRLAKKTSRCINFAHELTWQILTNHSIKIGREAWPTRDEFAFWSRVEGRGSRVTSRGSRVNSRGSRVTNQGSRVNGRGSKNPPQLFMNVVKSNFQVGSCLLEFPMPVLSCVVYNFYTPTVMKVILH